MLTVLMDTMYINERRVGCLPMRQWAIFVCPSPEVATLDKLEWLNLGWNDLTGAVPSELIGISTLKWLFLSANELSVGTVA